MDTKRKLSFLALKAMNDQVVAVKGLDGEFFRQCVVVVNYLWDKKIKKFSGIDLIDVDGEFLYSYDAVGNCQNGEFFVYAIKKEK